MKPAPTIDATPGFFRHFKGGIYYLLGEASHSEDNDELILYMSLKNKKLWVRPKNMFFEMVEHEGHKVARFERMAVNSG